ncbi:Lrp/AsnC family transcriptional regulator [Aneurinibacillus tyrosinisolvens]|uniref:Lrp/AsnC family transcriptional regulator n=1 Tax=Aneurinibacillus tyrosinisolvens TaxID=1443435 RepID=UPI00156854A0|nr:Lrp/AsnC family transcriptional regulator [Aneurinibacillus tyrosinisolvens]
MKGIIHMMIDDTDRAILEWLEKDARMQWKEIGEKVHLTGQAVAGRIRRMEEAGIIEGFTIKLNNGKIGKTLTAFITIFMKTTNHSSFQLFLKEKEEIEEAHRVSGEGCYWLKAAFGSEQELNRFLDELLLYGNYRVNLSIGQIK